MIDVGTVVWVVGLVLLAGAGGWALAGPVGACAAVGLVLTAVGVAADLAAPPRPGSERVRDRARELV